MVNAGLHPPHPCVAFVCIGSCHGEALKDPTTTSKPVDNVKQSGAMGKGANACWHNPAQTPPSTVRSEAFQLPASAGGSAESGRKFSTALSASSTSLLSVSARKISPHPPPSPSTRHREASAGASADVGQRSSVASSAFSTSRFSWYYGQEMSGACTKQR